MVAPANKYTDRDVRENEELADAALDYLRRYGGDFEFLLDCQQRLDDGEDLTVAMVRGVLNCMRADARVRGLPAPLPLEDSTVVAFEKPARRKRRREVRIPCDITDFHGPHGGFGFSEKEDDPYEYCSGKYPIDRPYSYDRPAKIKDSISFVIGKSQGTLVHKPSLDEPAAYVRWYPKQHEYGWLLENYAVPVTMYVRPACLTPRVLKDPTLLTKVQFAPFIENERSQVIRYRERSFCTRCFPSTPQGA